METVIICFSVLFLSLFQKKLKAHEISDLLTGSYFTLTANFAFSIDIASNKIPTVEHCEGSTAVVLQP